MAKLRNTLADACVVLGVDNDTELIHLSGGPKIGTDDLKFDKFGPYKQNVLAVFTETVAYFPEAHHQVEGTCLFTTCNILSSSGIFYNAIFD